LVNVDLMMSRIPNNRLTRVTVEIAICSICVAMLFVLYKNPVPIPRHKANRAARADLRNAATAQEAYFADHGTYCQDLNTLIGAEYGLFLSEGVTLTIMEWSSTAYTMTAYHESGDKTFTLKGPGGSVTPY
jgi:Tfp pilus assembly protein PilE